MAGTEEVLINDSGTSKKFSTQRFLDVKDDCTTSATSASNSAVAAAGSASSAAAVFDTFDDRYLGNKSSNPSTDNDSNALVAGALYFNTSTNAMMVYDGSAWITTSSATLSTLDTYKFTATSGQTVFTGADDASNTLAIKPTAEIVTLNGIVLESAADYTVTTTTLTLLVGATTGDDVNVLAFGNFELADHYNKVAADARYAPISVVNYNASTLQAEVDLNTAKTGITSSQASAITANTSKTGITSGQASAITANTAKTGITAGQASAITANTAKVTYPSADSTKLGGIEASADVTDTTNVTAAGALMDSEVTNLADVKAFAFGSTVQAYDADTAKLDTDQSWTGSQRGTVVVDNDGSFDMNGGNNFKSTPTGAVTLTFTNITNGQSGFILLVNSGQTISAHANTKVDANLLATVTAAGTYLIGYFSDGTNVYLTNSAIYA